MLTAGPRASLGLLSPGDRVIERGDRFTTAFGIWGSLTCRAGFVVEDASELPDGIRRLRRQARRAVFRGRGRVVRGAPRRPDRRHPPGHHRPAPRRPVLRHLPEPGPPAPSRRMGQLAGRAGLDDRTALRDGPPGRYHPGDRHGLLHDQHRGRHRPGRPVAARRARCPLPRRLGADRGSPALHGGGARHRAPPGRPAVLEHAGRSCRRSCCDRTGRWSWRTSGGTGTHGRGRHRRRATRGHRAARGRSPAASPPRVRPRRDPGAARPGHPPRRSVLLGLLRHGAVVQPDRGAPDPDRRAGGRPRIELPRRHGHPRPGLRPTLDARPATARSGSPAAAMAGRGPTTSGWASRSAGRRCGSTWP